MNLKQYLNFGFLVGRKKAFIFTLDVAIALVLVFSLLLLTNYFVVQKTQDPYSSLQSLRTGTDFIVIMDQKGYFNNPDEQIISDFLNDNLPDRFNMRIYSISGGSCDLEVGPAIPDDKSITSGKFYFKSGSDFCSARYQVWLD